MPTRERWLEAALFWSHDLDLGEECETDLCAQVLVVVDFAPSPHAGTVNVVYAVDTSGSMGPDASDLVRESLGASLDGIDAQDLGALVLFVETAKVAEKTRAMETSDRSGLIAGLKVDSQGGTNVDVGLAEALSVAAAAHGRSDRTHVVLFTDEPIEAAVDPDSVIGLVRRHAVAGISTTLFGVDNHLGRDLAWALERSVGARVEHLDDVAERTLAERMPAATNVQLTLEPVEGWAVTNSWLLGGSTSEEPDFGRAWIGGVYPEGNRAVAFVLEPVDAPVTALPEGTPLGALQLDWAGGDERLSITAGDTTAYSHTTIAADALGAYRFAALLDEAVALDDEDDSLHREVARMDDLAALIEEGAACF
ncbi:MAG: VWA domain-containing protein [Proteobacteria bacterium]|nr:VWA domain-containing protein [Pseudomonadota bacterium]